MVEVNRTPAEGVDQPAVRLRYRGNSLVPEAHPTFVRRGRRYVTSGRQRYENSLLAAVGFLELFNAVDFPANVWNRYPVPTFVLALMGLGGSVAIVGACSAFWDMRRSGKNIGFLLRERRYLKSWCGRVKTSNRPDSTRLLNACLDVNFRELGWEVADRFMMDAFMGVGGVIVGAGTLMAIWGDIPAVFRASNLLSGYVGNSFGAAYVLINSAWSIFMWRRAYSHGKAVSRADGQFEPHVRRRVRSHSGRHQLYALISGLAVFVAGIGSMISASMWQGYVVLIPCIIGSVFANYFWRHKLGYSRDSVQTWIDVYGFDILGRLKSAIAMHEALDEKSGKPTDLLPKTSEWTTNADVLQFLQENGLYGDFCAGLLKNQADAERVLGRLDDTVIVDPQRILLADHELIASAARACVRRVGRLRFRDEERYLLELLGCYLCGKDQTGRPTEEKDRDYCISPVVHRGQCAEIATSLESSEK